MKKNLRNAALLFFHFPFLLPAQTPPDTLRMDAVTVSAYLSEQAVLRLPSSVSVLDRQVLGMQQGTSLVPAMNTSPGVRMEERSPGSYRLSLRGSLLRSPFGIRNVKIYVDEIPLTDAGGNTYLNALDAGSVGHIEVLKGPDGSLFGANSGGVIRIAPWGEHTGHKGAGLSVQSGSYGLFHEQAAWRHSGKNTDLQLNQAFQRSDGYRENTALKRHYLQVAPRWNYQPGREIRGFAFYTDLQYQTPGGLTAGQFEADPQAARPATPELPGAIEQQAGIKNRTLLGGLIHEARFTDRFRHVLSLSGARTDFENPFITNYETRDERTLSLRTYFELKGHSSRTFRWSWNAGVEWQQTRADIRNYDNEGGQKGGLQAGDRIRTGQHFYFTRLALEIGERWVAEAAVSLNGYRYRFRDLEAQEADPEAGSFSRVKFRKQLMPRLAFSYLVSENMAWRASVSRGYSPPTTAEVRSSDNTINTDLQAENGWNVETGIRYHTSDNRFQADASVFYYRLEEAIVRRLREDGAEYFVNAGGTRQPGLEAQLSTWLLPPRQRGDFIRGIQLRNSFTWNHFTFRDYRDGEEIFSGNRLTGVPGQVLVSSLLIRLPENSYAYIRHNYTSRIPLNDANSRYAGSYHLVQLKAGLRPRFRGRINLEIFAGIDNLLNTTYSLGNDINAFGERYFNAAPPRNYYGGISLRM